MDNWLRPDPPGTINPAKLSRGVGAAPNAFGAFDTILAPTISDAQTAPEASTPPIPRSIVFPLPRISSDWDPERDIVDRGILKHQAIRKEFEDFHVAERRPVTATVRRTSHRGHFRSQFGDGLRTCVPVDLGAGPDATVVVDRATVSIYDAYLLRADITKNVNVFWRHQIVFNPESETYTLWTREGRVGLQGISRQNMESTDLKPVAARFRKIFRDKTGLAWNRRYESSLSRDGSFMFVELDYRGAVTRPKELPNYTLVDPTINEEVRDLMEVMLYGGPVRKRNGSENPGASGTWSAFSAPYEQLSPWTIFSAFKTLGRIRKHLESGRPIHWKTILRASSRYRSQIPFCSEYDRVPVISSYHAIFLELKFLHSLWPQQEIANMLTEIHCRGSQQFNSYKTLAQPLYQAYSSLRHGFRRLTDTSTLEFGELKKYLENSCHHNHYLTWELQDIYRVFIKANLLNPYRDWIEAKQAYDVCGERRLLLWHGTPLDSLLGILDLGLQIRRRGASWTGTMFGNGIYLADASSKSAGFCKHRLWDGEAVLLLCEADVGAQRIRSPNSISNGHDVIEKSGGRYRCIEGLGRVGPVNWKEVGWEMGGLPCTDKGTVSMVKDN
ncbi:hypothetical protein DL764_001271 [Monosporascus ibericus]|uniref:Poly [ADP-ribose] polymerase n=1 Tax=Monosporascus ibericus TaxID=155417 RepID=A0A4Q4TRW6_9PEZI|nr:hypothetical protein DL764_001271 [Monosporascus ibericus]